MYGEDGGEGGINFRTNSYLKIWGRGGVMKKVCTKKIDLESSLIFKNSILKLLS